MPCTRQRKDAVKGLTGGIEFLFKKNKIEWLKGQASFESADTVKVGDRNGPREEHCHRDGLFRHSATRRRNRREDRRLLDRCAGAGEGAEPSRRHWRRRDRT